MEAFCVRRTVRGHGGKGRSGNWGWLEAGGLSYNREGFRVLGFRIINRQVGSLGMPGRLEQDFG